eukprot:15477062-Alexandrium_andersonii.AAC.1
MLSWSPRRAVRGVRAGDSECEVLGFRLGCQAQGFGGRSPIDEAESGISRSPDPPDWRLGRAGGASRG